MSFRHACFISYCHGQHDLVKTFVDQLEAGINNYLDAYFDEKVYVDRRRLEPGYLYDEALARAICESVCMVVVYSPRYERHSYCLREFAAMERIEKQRRLLLGQAIHGRGMIIPVIFKGGSEIPEKIKNTYHYSDFSSFTLATTDMSRNPAFIVEIEKICKVIHEHYETFETTGKMMEACKECMAFEIPKDAPKWRGIVPSLPFPGREG